MDKPGVSYTIRTLFGTLGSRQSEPIGNIQLWPALFCPAYVYPLYQQSYEVAAFVERLLSVSLYLLLILSEGHEPRLRDGC